MHTLPNSTHSSPCISANKSAVWSAVSNGSPKKEPCLLFCFLLTQAFSEPTVHGLPMYDTLLKIVTPVGAVADHLQGMLMVPTSVPCCVLADECNIG